MAEYDFEYDLVDELSEDEKNNIYNFITGTNSAGESLISTALNFNIK